jgi:hypothetical protein
MADEEKKDADPAAPPPNGSTKYEEELGAYLHLKIEERQQPEMDLEKAIIPDAVRKQKFWKRFHTHRKIFASRTAEFLKDSRKMFILWLIIFGMVAIGLYFNWDRGIVGGTIVIFGIVSSAFAWLAAGLLSLIGLIPFIGPLLVTILSSSLLWIINALGYFVSVVAIKAGHGKTVLNYRLLVIVFLTGMVTGYVVAKIIQ